MSLSGGHETILTDYQISNVPGFETLYAGALSMADKQRSAPALSSGTAGL
jgi:hypothetical protein